MHAVKSTEDGFLASASSAPFGLDTRFLGGGGAYANGADQFRRRNTRRLIRVYSVCLKELQNTVTPKTRNEVMIRVDKPID